MSFSLSRVSILLQILIGYVPVIIVLAFLAFLSFQNYKNFDQSLDSLQDITKENLTFLEIERDVVELQRNVLVYSYIGYKGVLRKIEFLQKQLEEKFSLIEPIVQKDIEIKDRFDRMVGHYHNYKKGFEAAIKEKQQLQALISKDMTPLIQKAHGQLDLVNQTFLKQSDFDLAYNLSQIERNLSKSSSNIRSFRASPDPLLLNDTIALTSSIQNESEALKGRLDKGASLKQINTFLEVMREYKSVLKKITLVNRNYLNLVNVVLAGKAAEIDTLSNELDQLITQRSQELSSDIKNNIQRSQQQFIMLSLLAGLIGVISSTLIAMGIANPVRAMAETLSKLAKGTADIEIPGQTRKDEVGQMAKAANEFKIMAGDLEGKTAELEEFAYRTSHDLRSPLVSSISLLNLAQRFIDDDNYDKAKKSMGLVQTSLNKLETLVKDILELTKTKNIAEEAQDITFQSIVDEALNKFSHMDGFERLEIQKDLQFSEPLEHKKSRIVLVIENLLSNSIKYQDITKEKSFIKISIYPSGENIAIEVEDNGLGIPEKQQTQMFMMFKRFHPKTSFGSGLGLYMIKKSANVLGGDIFFEDTGRGSKFKLVFPKQTEEIKE